jgi:GNAT superfamily N-acetyltransferase
MTDAAPGGLGGGFWGEIQARFVYYSDRLTQQRIRDQLRAALATGALDDGLKALAINDTLTPLVEAGLARRADAGWEPQVRTLLEALAAELAREVRDRAPVQRIPDAAAQVERVIMALPDYDPTDILEISADPGLPVWVNYISRRMSPRYDGAKGAWDRDTQYMYEMNFDSGLFIWLSLATAPEFQGRGVGTRFVKAAEALAVSLGFRRFSVLGPNNGPYWTTLGYTSHTTPLMTNLEAYMALTM